MAEVGTVGQSMQEVMTPGGQRRRPPGPLQTRRLMGGGSLEVQSQRRKIAFELLSGSDDRIKSQKAKLTVLQLVNQLPMPSFPTAADSGDAIVNSSSLLSFPQVSEEIKKSNIAEGLKRDERKATKDALWQLYVFRRHNWNETRDQKWRYERFARCNLPAEAYDKIGCFLDANFQKDERRSIPRESGLETLRALIKNFHKLSL